MAFQSINSLTKIIANNALLIQETANNSYTRMLEGGALSIIDSNTAKVSRPKAIFKLNYADEAFLYEATDDIMFTVADMPPFWGPNTVAYFYLKSDGTLSITDAGPTVQNVIDEIPLGSITSLFTAGVFGVALPFVINSDPEAKRMLAMGPLNLSSGDFISINASNTLSLDTLLLGLAGQNYWNDKLNPHFLELPAESPKNFIYITSNGAVVGSGSFITELDYSLKEDPNTGLAISNNRASIQTLFILGNGAAVIQLSIQSYNSQNQAINRYNNDFTPIANVVSNFVKLADILVEPGEEPIIIYSGRIRGSSISPN